MEKKILAGLLLVVCLFVFAGAASADDNAGWFSRMKAKVTGKSAAPDTAKAVVQTKTAAAPAAAKQAQKSAALPAVKEAPEQPVKIETNMKAAGMKKEDMVKEINDNLDFEDDLYRDIPGLTQKTGADKKNTYFYNNVAIKDLDQATLEPLLDKVYAGVSKRRTEEVKEQMENLKNIHDMQEMQKNIKANQPAHQKPPQTPKVPQNPNMAIPRVPQVPQAPPKPPAKAPAVPQR